MRIGKKQINLFAVIAIGSMLLLYGIFFIFPIMYGAVGSFADWNPIKGTFRFIGLDNYIELLSDKLFWQAVLRTMIFTAVCTVLTTAIGLALATLIHNTKRFSSLFKTFIYLPYVTAIMSISVIWRWIFLGRGGLLNNIIALFGGQGLDWLNSSSMVMPSLMIMTIWHDVGFALILFIAGLAEIPSSLYEAARVDGANNVQIFRKITIPMLSKTTALVVVSNIITYVQVYDQIVALTKGGPGDSSYTATYYLFDKALGYYRFGYASATAIVLLLVIMGLSILQFKLSSDS